MKSLFLLGTALEYSCNAVAKRVNFFGVFDKSGKVKNSAKKFQKGLDTQINIPYIFCRNLGKAWFFA